MDSMSASALWRRLDLPGHDAALLRPAGDGHSLHGVAVFKHPAGPVCISYCVEVDALWRTLRGRVQGFLAGKRLDHIIVREANGWHLDGTLIAGVEELQDLDYSFTPATNLLQLRRAGPNPGGTIDLPVAWFDIDRARLSVLPQRYERRDAHTYRYHAATVPYEGLLELAPDGFVKHYPGLWEAEG